MLVRVSLSSACVLTLSSCVALFITAGVRGDAKGPVKVVCFGDSITEGHRITDAFTTPYPDMLRKMLDEKKGKGGFEVVNAGVSGQDTHQGLARVDEVLRKEKPDWMLILYGTNDLWSTRKMAVSDTDRNLRAIVTKAKAAGAKCIIGTIIPVWDFDAKVSERNESIRKIANDEGIGLVDMNAAFEKAVKAAGGRAGKAAWEKYYQVEEGGFVHPNDAGNRLIAEKWFEALDEAPAAK